MSDQTAVTREDVERLKLAWRRDPCWDIEDTEGFEEHREELLAFRDQCEREWQAACEAKWLAKAEQVGFFNYLIPSNEPYTQHVCPNCKTQNGENESGVIVQCPKCDCEYRVPQNPELAPARNAEIEKRFPWVKIAEGKSITFSVCDECGKFGVMTETKHVHTAWVPSYADEDGTGFENYTTTDWDFKCAECGHVDGEQGGY